MHKEIHIWLVLFGFIGCANPNNATRPESTDAVVENEVERQHSQPRSVDIPFPYGLHPQIARITLRSGTCSLDGKEYESLQAILNELDKRRVQIQETGIFCELTDKRGNKSDGEAFGDLFEYCKINDIDLFYSFPLGLPPLDNLLNIYWGLQSTQTRYVLPETQTKTKVRTPEKKHR